jgi:hypothetical protein
MSALAAKNAIDVHEGRDFKVQMSRLIQRIEAQPSSLEPFAKGGLWDQPVSAAHDRPDDSSNPVAPTILQKKPFGENVEGLSHCRDESYSSMSVLK